jgi:hypothetical protein
MDRSACAVPATSHVRRLSLSSCLALWKAQHAEQVGLRQELQHGHVDVVADPRHALAQDRLGIDQRRTPAAAAVDQEAVVDAG